MAWTPVCLAVVCKDFIECHAGVLFDRRDGAASIGISNEKELAITTTLLDIGNELVRPLVHTVSKGATNHADLFAASLVQEHSTSVGSRSHRPAPICRKNTAFGI